LKLKYLGPFALIICLAFVSACGDDDGNGNSGETPDEVTLYFQELSGRAALANVQLVALDQQFPAALEEVEPTRQYYAEYVRVYSEFVTQMNGLVPPAEVAEEHEAFITATEGVRDISQQRLEQLQGAETKEQLDAIFAASDEFTEAVARQDFACSELKRIADDKGVPVPGLQDCNNFN
jgi:hypothetical protein